MLKLPFIKLCCISSEEEVDAAVDAGATALGLVSDVLGGPGIIPDARVGELARYAKAQAPLVDTVLLTNITEKNALLEQVTACETTAVQLCAAVATAEMDWLRTALPSMVWIHVIHVAGPEAVDEARARADAFDAFILDSKVDGALDDGRPQLGGTGIQHDWSISRAIVDAVQTPVILAGGLTAENVASAIGQVRPAGVDVCSGIRRDDAVNVERASRFVAAARSALPA